MEAAGFPIEYPADQEPTAQAMAAAVEQTVQVLRGRWGLPDPKGCRLYVLGHWREFLDRTVPFWLRPMIFLTKPIWRSRIDRTYALAGGWMLPWPGRPSIGVKPPELLESADRRLGECLYVPVPDLLEKVMHIAGHELTHAFTAFLRLPPWLNEGLAMRAVDHLAGGDTILEETRRCVRPEPASLGSRAYRRLAEGDHDALIELYATGYWLTRQLDDGDGSRMKALLERRRPHRWIHRRFQDVSREFAEGNKAG
jgi:hypothetical protein